jgi:hypothetical protein
MRSQKKGELNKKCPEELKNKKNHWKKKDTQSFTKEKE